MSEATQVLEGIKSLTAEELPVLNVQAIAEAATRNIVEALSGQPHAELERLPEAVLLPAEPILLAPEVVSLLRASLKAGLSEVTNKVLWLALKD
jgi:hypothetical protein